MHENPWWYDICHTCSYYIIDSYRSLCSIKLSFKWRCFSWLPVTNWPMTKVEIQAHEADVEFLKRHHVMDYSVLVGALNVSLQGDCLWYMLVLISPLKWLHPLSNEPGVPKIALCTTSSLFCEGWHPLSRQSQNPGKWPARWNTRGQREGGLLFRSLVKSTIVFSLNPKRAFFLCSDASATEYLHCKLWNLQPSPTISNPKMPRFDWFLDPLWSSEASRTLATGSAGPWSWHQLRGPCWLCSTSGGSGAVRCWMITYWSLCRDSVCWILDTVPYRVLPRQIILTWMMHVGCFLSAS